MLAEMSERSQYLAAAGLHGISALVSIAAAAGREPAKQSSSNKAFHHHQIRSFL